MSVPPNPTPLGGYPQSGEGYDPTSGAAPGSAGQSQSGWSAGFEPPQPYGQSLFGGQTGGYQPTQHVASAHGGYGEPEPQWGQPSGYPGEDGYGTGEPPPRSSALPWIIGVLVVLLVAGGVLLFFLLKDDTPTPVATTTSATSSSSAATTDEQSSGETTEETTEDTSTPTPTPEVGLPPPAGIPAPIGSGDANVDALAQGCFSGDMKACDDLYKATAGPDLQNPDPTPELQAFFDFAFTCGERLTEAEIQERFCVIIWPDA